MAGSPDAGGVALVRSVRLAGRVAAALGPAASVRGVRRDPAAGRIPLEPNRPGVSGGPVGQPRSRAAGVALQPASGREWCRASGQRGADRPAGGRGAASSDHAGAVVLRSLRLSPGPRASESGRGPAGSPTPLDGLADASRLDRPCGDRRQGLECVGAGCGHSRYGLDRTSARRRHQLLPRPFRRHQVAAGAWVAGSAVHPVGHGLGAVDPSSVSQ